MAQIVLDNRRSAWRDLVARVDLVLLTSTLAVAALGVVMVYSATRTQLTDAGLNPHYYLLRQGLYTSLGLGVMAVFALVDYHRWEELAAVVYCGLMLGLLAVLTPVGSSQLGSQRWIQLGGFQLQPSAFAALALVIVAAAYLARQESSGAIPLRKVALLLVMAGVPTILVVKQPDLGSGLVMGVSLLAVIVVAGVRGRHLVGLGALGGLLVLAVLHLHLLHGYQLQRLSTFVDPSHAPRYALYNLRQSKIAIGSGGVLGKGLFHGSQTNLAYVPEQYADFIFTAVGEQLGFVGAASLLALFAVMIWRAIRAAQLARDSFGRLLCAGVIGMIAFSVFQNTGMTMGIMPITGIPLPFVSYGGSATLAFSAGMGLVLNVGMRRYA